MQPSGFSSFSAPFILRPIGTALLAAGLFLLGAVAYVNLPVASLPTVDFPTLRVQASRPGADPETMAATIAAPLERRLGEIAGVTELTSVSSQGTTGISIQFDLSRNIDGAARDVQAALNAATADLPSDLPQVPTFRKLNPSAAPVLILAMTSKVLAPTALYDVADTVIAQRMSQVDGVAQVQVSGAEQPAVRVRVNPTLLQSMGLSMEDVRSAIDATNNLSPVGAVEADKQQITLSTNDQLRKPEDYGALVIKTINGDVVRLSSVASVEQGSRNTRSAAMFDHQPAVLLIISKQPDANVIDTVDRVKALLPDLQRWIPAGIDISVLSDRTTTIRASVADMQLTLTISIALVMLVVFVFLRRLTPTAAAGITVPLSLAGTCTVMWALGYSVNNLTLMAFAIAVGFVVDDAIVMIENIYRNLERGLTPMAAALEGARQIGFTVLSISISLIAAFIPVLFMSGIVGRLLREFSVTLAAAIAVSVVVSLSVTPMICAHFLKPESNARPSLFDRVVEGALNALVKGYARTLTVALRHQAVTLFTLLCVIVLTMHLYAITPKGFFPDDDTGLIMANTEAAADVSYEAMVKLQSQALDIILADPAVNHVGSSVGASGFSASVNQGRMFISLKSLSARSGNTTTQVIDRMRKELADLRGIDVRLVASRDIRVGARQGNSAVPIHALGPRHRRALRVGAEDPRAAEADSRAGRRDLTTARTAVCSSTSRSIATPPRGSASASMTSTTRSTTPSRSARSRRSTASATSTASSSRSIRSCSATRPICRTIYVPGADGTQVPLLERRHDRRRRWRRSSSITRGRSRPSRSPTIWRPASRSTTPEGASTQAIAELHMPTRSAASRPATRRPSPSRPRSSRC